MSAAYGTGKFPARIIVRDEATTFFVLETETNKVLARGLTLGQAMALVEAN